MKNTKRKGFTIVELVIVIAVIAILAAVLIPTFASVIKKANQSADIQAVHQMNTALAVDGAVTPTSITGLYDALEEAGMTAKDYTPLYSNRCFYWVKSLNQVIYYDRGTGDIVFPENVTETKGWYALDGSFDTSSATIKELPAESANTYTFTIASAADFVKAAELVSKKSNDFCNKSIVIKITEDVDLKGADVNFLSVTATEKNGMTFPNVTLEAATEKTITGLYVSDKHGVTGTGSAGTNDNYGHSLFNRVHNLTVKNITIKDSAIGGYGASQAAFFAGLMSGEADLSNVTVENCEVQGEKKVATLISFLDGNVKLDDVSIKNCNVSTLQGEAGVVFGIFQSYKVPSSTNLIAGTAAITNSTATVASQNSVVTKTIDGTEYKMVEYTEGNGKAYRVTTSEYGFYMPYEKNTSDFKVKLNVGDAECRNYQPITADRLSDLKGTKSN